MENTAKKRFTNEFDKLCKTKDAWDTWTDLISCIACVISNFADNADEHFLNRTSEYETRAAKLGGDEVIKKFILIIGDAFNENPEQDFLGELYMEYNLGKHCHGQFFSPYSIAKFMASLCELQTSNIKSNGFGAITDPACGSGVMLIAAINKYRDVCNFQQELLCVGQDIDRVAAQMCYIQLSILGCAGYICVGDTLKNPIARNEVLLPVEKEGQELWLTPMFTFGKLWNKRKEARKILLLERLQRKLAESVS